MQYDLIVVGSGFASTFFLKKYLQKNTNKKILVLERGKFFPHLERLKIKRGDASVFNKEAIHETYENHSPEKPWNFSLGFGGSSNCWWAGTPRFMPSDFKMKSLFGILEDWPVAYEDLVPYYEEAENIMSIAGPEETPFPKSSKYPMPAHLFSEPDTILHKRYGSLYIAQPCARPSVQTTEKNQCLGYFCCDTCPVNAKFTIENSCQSIYAQPGVEIQYDCNVYELVIEKNKAKSVKFVRDGKEFEISGNVIVLGANPIFNCNILLNSGDSNPLTGKGFGEQMGVQSLVYLKNMNSRGGSTWVNANGFMLYDGPHRAQYAGCLMEVNNVPHVRLEEDKWLDVMPIRLIYEDMPQKNNYITNSKDKLKPHVYFKDGRSLYALKGFEETKSKFMKVLDPLPVEEIRYLPMELGEGHIIGGTPMGNSIEKSVVNKFMQHHSFENVIVLGLSLIHI